MIEIHQFPCLSDNYGYLIHDPETGETAAIDTPDANEYLRQAALKDWTITQIWNTHWHPDHAGGNVAIKDATGCTISAAKAEVDKIAGIDCALEPGDTVKLGAITAEIMDVSGHTNGHIAYYLPSENTAFVGDALFALGCGRMFEGNPTQMWSGLKRLKALPPETVIYCAHEYTAANAKFALHVDGNNAALQAYADEVLAKRERGEWTVPTVLKREKEANPFLRADARNLQAHMGTVGDDVATFAALRSAKDNF